MVNTRISKDILTDLNEEQGEGSQPVPCLHVREWGSEVPKPPKDVNGYIRIQIHI
jgi:hypothetical protein